MSTDANKQFVQRYYDEVLNAGNVNLVDELAAEDYEEHDPLPGQGNGREGLKERASLFVSALAPRFTVHDVIAEDDKVVVRWTNDGQQVGDFLGMPPTGRSFSIAGIDIHRIRDDRLAEHWHVVDQLTMLQQLGVIPTPGS